MKVKEILIIFVFAFFASNLFFHMTNAQNGVQIGSGDHFEMRARMM